MITPLKKDKEYIYIYAHLVYTVFSFLFLWPSKPRNLEGKLGRE
jgi:hypothetical protein